MNKALACILLMSVACVAGAEPWTVDRAVAVALKNNPDALAARARIEAAEAVVDQARSAWMPQLSISGRYIDTNSPMMAFGSILNQRGFNFGLDFNHPGRIDDLNGTGTLAYNLYSGGQASARRDAARAGGEAAGEDFRASQNQLAADVVKAVLNIRKARDMVAAMQGGVAAYEAAAAAAKARYDAGQLLKADLLSIEVQLAQTRENLSEAKHARALAARAFEFLLGMDPASESVEIAADDPVLAGLTLPDTRDFSHRPELIGLQARERAARSMVEAAGGARRPTVNAFASYQVDEGWVLNRHADSWLGGLSVDLNVFDGGLTSGRIREAKANLVQVQQMMRKASLGIALEVEQARLAHDDAAERLSVSTAALAQAEESASLSRARFEKEALLASELIGAEGRLLEAKLRHTVAEADERSALVDLRRALGLDPVPSLSFP